MIDRGKMHWGWDSGQCPPHGHPPAARSGVAMRGARVVGS